MTGPDTRPRHVYLTAATAGSSTASAPVGGGVAVVEGLLPHLARELGEAVTLLRPGPRAAEGRLDGVRVLDLQVAALAGASADRLLELDERAYARFAIEWERALGRFLDDVDPAGALVVANDVSEGPPFSRLAERGFRQLVLYHVVVAEFFARRYLRGPLGLEVAPPTAARAWRALESVGLTRLAPELLRLVWNKEGQAARFADAIVPSQPLADALAACYPDSRIAERTEVVPWGVIGPADPARRARREATLGALGVDPRRRVLVTLSRISPEKRLELLVDALARLERSRPEPAGALTWIVAGAPAYMGGAAYAEGLRRRAGELELVDVRFAGYVGGEAKWDLLAAADLFASTSSYEAYGLTIAQALASGSPVVATDHQGARSTLTPDLGLVVPARADELARALVALLEEPPAEHAARRDRAAAWGRAHPFEQAARRTLHRIASVRAR